MKQTTKTIIGIGLMALISACATAQTPDPETSQKLAGNENTSVKTKSKVKIIMIGEESDGKTVTINGEEIKMGDLATLTRHLTANLDIQSWNGTDISSVLAIIDGKPSLKGDEIVVGNDGNIQIHVHKAHHTKHALGGEHKDAQVFFHKQGDTEKGFPKTVDIDDRMVVLIEEDGQMKVLKDGKVIDPDSYGDVNMTVNKVISNNNGKRKTRIVIEMDAPEE